MSETYDLPAPFRNSEPTTMARRATVLDYTKFHEVDPEEV
jgi:hypothetical protein